MPIRPYIYGADGSKGIGQGRGSVPEQQVVNVFSSFFFLSFAEKNRSAAAAVERVEKYGVRLRGAGAVTRGGVTGLGGQGTTKKFREKKNIFVPTTYEHLGPTMSRYTAVTASVVNVIIARARTHGNGVFGGRWCDYLAPATV